VFRSAFRHILWRLLRRGFLGQLVLGTGSPAGMPPRGRLQTRTVAGFKSERVAGFIGSLIVQPRRATALGLACSADAPTKKNARPKRGHNLLPHHSYKIDKSENPTYGARDSHRALGTLWTSAATQGRSRRPQERVNEAPELRHRREFRAACEACDVCIIRWYIRINNRLRRATRTGKFFGHGISQEPLIQGGRISDRSSDQTNGADFGDGGGGRSEPFAMWQSDVSLTPISCQYQDIFAASSRCPVSVMQQPKRFD
jgi:hypothetical protein